MHSTPRSASSAIFCRSAALYQIPEAVTPVRDIRISICLIQLRMPVKATTVSGTWRPRDPVDGDQGGARA